MGARARPHEGVSHPRPQAVDRSTGQPLSACGGGRTLEPGQRPDGRGASHETHGLWVEGGEDGVLVQDRLDALSVEMTVAEEALDRNDSLLGPHVEATTAPHRVGREGPALLPTEGLVIALE